MQSLLNEAVAHHQAGRHAQAEAGYSALLRMDPNHPDALHLLGVRAHESGHYQKAVALIQRALGTLPNFPDAHLNLGNALDGLGDQAGARAAYERAIALKPGFTLAHLNLADLLNRMGVYEVAEQHARVAVRLEPATERGHRALWRSLRGQQRQLEAAVAMQSAIALRSGVPMMLCELGSTLAEGGDTDSALVLHRQAVAMEPENPDIHMGLAKSLHISGDLAAALPVLQRVIELAPGSIEGRLNLGWTLRGLGRFDEARECFNQILELDPNQPEAHWNLSLMGPVQETAPAQEAELRALMQGGGLTLFQRASAGFALGKALNDQDRYDEAFTAFAAANKMIHDDLVARKVAFDPAACSAQVDAIIANYPAASFTARQDVGVMSELPVFVVGMPRSGTTLVEQIAASHSQVHGAGELRDIYRMNIKFATLINSAGPLGAWNTDVIQPVAKAHLARLARLGGGALRVIDKTPDNVFWLGMIATLFPGARVILCNRDPRDTCLSHFFQLFTAGNPFSYDLGECGWRARETNRLMDHWRAVLPIKVLNLQYETLVEDLETQARVMIEFLGLEWEPACLDFHRTKRPVATPNMWAVRQPIYTRAAGRWRNYEKYLSPMFAALEGQRPGG